MPDSSGKVKGISVPNVPWHLTTTNDARSSTYTAQHARDLHATQAKDRPK